MTETETTTMNPAAQTVLTAAIRTTLSSREQSANVDVFFPFVRLSREVVAPDGSVGIIKTTFRFDGDLVLLRGLSKAANDLAALASQARHEGLAVH